MTARIDTTSKLKIQINGRCEMQTMHLMDAEVEEEEAFCKAKVSGHDLPGVDDYLERRARAVSHHRQAEEAEIEAVRYRNGTKRRALEAAELEEETLAYRRPSADLHGRPARRLSASRQIRLAPPFVDAFLRFQHNEGLLPRRFVLHGEGERGCGVGRDS